MSKTVAVSFEGNQVKIVHASLKGHDLSVDRTEVIPDDSLDAYLRGDKATEFIVTCEFKGSYHGVLTTPIVKSKYLGKIVESKIRKASGEKDLAFIYSPIGERVIENRKALEVFYYAVSNTDLKNVAEIFYDNGKTVKAIYPSVFSAVSLSDPGEEGEGCMGVFSMGNERTVFLTKNRAVYFVRNYESLDAHLSDFDIQSINMTINFCFQNLRINPSSVMLMGNLANSSDINSLPTAGLASFYKTDNVKCSINQFNEFILPIASFFTSKSANILNRDFKNIYLLRHYMAYSSLLFIVLSVLCLGYIFYEVKDISDKKNSIEMAKTIIADIESVHMKYIKKEAEMRKYRSAVDYLNRSTPDMQNLLIGLASIKSKDVVFNSIQVIAKDDSVFLVTIDGMSSVQDYSTIEASMKNMLGKLGEIEGVTVKDKALDITSKIFKVDMEYRSIE